ncbi:hypothetical protein KY330_05580 [Candidatus Woesearchaeota archaeon]|nr:hypothetical protein [Candidatus Woesearchaeota archaeon]
MKIWQICELQIPYYVDYGLHEYLNQLYPHQHFTGSHFPRDFTLKTDLLPFVMAINHFGYVGLDNQGYFLISTAMKHQEYHPALKHGLERDFYFGLATASSIPMQAVKERVLEYKEHECIGMFFPTLLYVDSNREIR